MSLRLLRFVTATLLAGSAWFIAPKTSFFVYFGTLTLLMGAALVIVPKSDRLQFAAATLLIVVIGTALT